jgi:hypothetical protein
MLEDIDEWEFKVITLRMGPETIAALDQLDEDGWEVLTMHQAWRLYRYITVDLKRRKQHSKYEAQ